MQVKVYAMIGPSVPPMTHLLIEATKDIKDVVLSLPLEHRQNLFKLEKTINIEIGEKRIALNTDEAINGIKQSGYYFNRAEIIISVGVN